MKIYLFILISCIMPGFVVAYAHTIDSVGEYRLEIGWMNEPVVSGETNGIELFVSTLDPNLPPEDQNFTNGISGLEKTLKIQLVYGEEKIILPLESDHNIPGKYYAFVNPTVSGYYQANILGNIADTTVSLSMHPPKVEERGHIEFPQPSDLTLQQIITGHTALVSEITDMKKSITTLETSNTQIYLGYVGIGLGIVGIIIASVAFSKSTNQV